MEERDQRILAHVGLYRISLRPILERHFFEGASCGNVVRRLLAEEYVQVRKGLPGNISYYQLGKSGVHSLGMPASRAAPFGAQALRHHLAIVWFCCMGKTLRFRLEESHVRELLPEDPPAGEHCLEPSDRSPVVYQLYVPAPDASVHNIVRAIHLKHDAAHRKAGLKDWIKSGQYGFAILVETPELLTSVRAALQRVQQGSRPLADTRVTFELVPGHRTLRSAFRDASSSQHAGR